MYNLEKNNNYGLNLFDDFNDFFCDVLGKDMKTNIMDDGEAYVVTSEIPGVAKENIKINLEDNTLTINVKNESNCEKKEYLQKERVFMNMSRKYYLENSNPEEIKAKLADGILTINVGKIKPELPQKRTISIE